MDLAFNDDQDLLRETTRRYLDDHGGVAAVRAVIEADEVVDRSAWTRGAELGWTAMLVPPEHDGGSVSEQPIVDLMVLAEELGRVLHPGPFVPTNVVADAIARSGSEAARRRWLPGIAAGTVLAAWCATGDASVDPAAVDVTAVEVDGGLRLDGMASFVHGASVADVLLVAATTGERVVQVLVPATAAGVSMRVITGLDLTRRFAEVRFEGVAVPPDDVLDDGGGFRRAAELAIVLQAGEAVGAADHLVAATVQYAKDREQFGRAIGSFQAIKHRLADLHVALEAMRAAAHYAALGLNDGFADATEAVHVAGSYVDSTLSFICGEALQLHGGIGFTWEHDVHLFLRRAKAAQTLYGDPPWHREQLCTVIEELVGEA